MHSRTNSWRKRLLAWVLTFSMLAGISHTAVRAEDSPVLLTGEQATKATELLYEENFNYEDATLQAGENEAYQLYVPSGATAKVEDGKLYFETAGSTPLYILGGEMWGYYTVEADITYATEAAAADLCFYVKNENAWSEGSLTSGANGGKYRMKVVANGTTASMYYAPYTLGVQDDWSEAQNVDVAVSAQSGSVGFAMTPAEGAESAAMYIDNIKVTRNMDVEEAKHTLMSVNFDKYTSSTTMSTSNKYTNYYIKTSSTGISVKGTEQKLYITGDGNGYGVMYFDVADAVHWDNYVVEVDMCQTNDTGFGSVLYRVQNLQSFQSGGLYGNGTAGLKGYWNGWANDGKDNGILHATSVTDAAANEIRRLKIVVNEDMADLYVASYADNDNTQALGEWEYLMSIDDIADHHEKGSVGFLTAEGASFWIDNLEVYEYTTTYYEDFNSYEDVTLAEGADATTGLTVDLNAKTGLETASSVALADGAVVVTGNTADSFDMAWLTAGTNWTNYTYEADVTPLNTVSSGWHGLAYRVEDRTLWQRAGMRNNGTTSVINYLGYCQNEKYKTIKTNSVYEGYVKSSNIGFAKNTTLRVKVVVENNCTWLYSASYNATTGILGPYSLHAVLDACQSFTGSVGMVVGGARAVKYDNIVVSATTKEAGTTNIAEITAPKTGIINPSVVVTKVDANNLYQLDGTAVAMMDINSDLDIVSNDGVIGSVSQFMNVYGDTVIPAFYIDSEAEVTAICEYLKENVITDAFYVTDDATLLKSARDTWGFARGILEYKTMPTDHAAARREINSNLAMVVILPKEGLSLELVTEYHARLVSVWSYAENTADVYKGIAAGYAGMITSTPATILDVYESITTTTLSGEPIAIGHQGGGQDAGYEGNTIVCYQAGVDLGAKIIEVDPKMTSDGHIIMMHDTTIDGTTPGSGKIADMTLAEIQEYKTDGGQPIPTFEDVLDWLKTTDAVMQIDHSEANAEYMAAMSALIAEYGLEDQVCTGTYRQVQQDNTYVWTNSDWGEGIPIIGGELWISQFYDSNTTKEEYIADMIHTIAPYNHQAKPFDYNEPNDKYGALSSYGKILSFYDEETLSYEVAARGFLNMQSATDTIEGIDKAYITQRGTSIVSLNTLDPIKDYCYQIQAEDEFVKIGDALDLTQTVTKIQGTADVDCKVQWLSGDAIVRSGDSYTMNKEGSATVVYYTDITQKRTYGDLTYRIYSEPVTITWNEDGKPDGIDWELFAGKKVSILGDSISTYANVSNNTSYNTTIGKNNVYYNANKFEESGVKRPDTWWQQIIDFLDMELCVNNSWSSSAILTERAGTVGAYVDRCVQLHNDTGDTNVDPDVIWLFMGTNDLSYYKSTWGSADAVDYDSLYSLNDDGTYTYNDPETVYEAYAIMLHKMKIRYEGVQIYCMGMMPRRDPVISGATDVGQPTELNAGIKKVALKMGCTYIDLESAFSSDPEEFDVYFGDQKLHPNTLGMDVMTKTVMATMLDDPNAACRIMTDLTDVTSSSTDKLLKNGSSFETKLTKAADDLEYMDVTVTMGGKDITAQCYADGKISIESVTGDVQITAKAYGEHTYTYDGNVYYHWEVCSCGDTRGKEVHTPELVGQRDATETVAGYTGDKVCSVCDYVIEKGDVIANNRFAGYTFVTPEDFGFTYGEALPKDEFSEASKTPSGSMDKVVFVTKLNSFAKGSQLVYMRDANGDYFGLQISAVTNSGQTEPVYLRMWNYLPSGSADDRIYLSPEFTTPKEFININTYGADYNIDPREEFELGISTEFGDYDNDNNGTYDDVKVGIWLNGKLYKDQYYYLKDCADICQPGLRIKAKEGTNFQEPTYIVPAHTHNYGEWKHDKEGHWHVCTSCDKVADQVLHVETLIGYKEATATENGYSGDKVCETCGYVIEQGETTYYREWAGYRILTPKDFGFTYDTPIESGATKSASIFPEGTLDKTVFVTKMTQGVGRLVYLRDAEGTYNGLTFLGSGISESKNEGYFALSNNLPKDSASDVIYRLSNSTGKYSAYSTKNVNINAYGITDIRYEFELAITLDYCCMDDDGEKNDIKIGIWLDGQQYVKSASYSPYFYLKDCVERIQPGLRLDKTQGATAFIDPTVSDITIQPIITDSIAMTYTATINSMMLKVATPQMTFERDGKIYGPVTGHPIAAGSNVYSFTYPDIMAQDMAQTIKATLTVGTQTKVYEHSVLQYCEDVLRATSLEGYTDTELTAAKALVVDLVQYGAALQTYRGVAAEELHTAKIAKWSGYVAEYDKEDTTLDSLNGSESVIKNKLVQEEGVEASTDYQWKSVTLVLGNKVKLRYRFTASNVYNLTVKLQVGDNEAVDVAYEKTSEEGVYVFDFDDIYAYEYGTPITVRFYEGNTQVGGTVNYSVNTYLYGMRNYNGSKAEELEALLLAIHNYGEAAQSYQSYRDAE